MSLDALKNFTKPSLPSSEQLDGQINTLIGSVKDPIGGILLKTITSLDNLSSNINRKVNNLIEDINKNSTNYSSKIENGKVILVNKTGDRTTDEAYKKALDGKINSIRSNIRRADSLLRTLNTVSRTTLTLKRVMDIQEAALTLNPLTKGPFLVFKKAFKILIFKEMLEEYTKILRKTILDNQKNVDTLKNTFNNLTVSLEIQEMNDKGLIANEFTVTQNFVNQEDKKKQSYENASGNIYDLEIRSQRDRFLFAVAIDRATGRVIAQTAASSVRNAEQLFEEIKEILET